MTRSSVRQGAIALSQSVSDTPRIKTRVANRKWDDTWLAGCDAQDLGAPPETGYVPGSSPKNNALALALKARA